MNEYSMEELILVVANLAEKYTGKESTSVTYEKAQQLMEAVVYCIHHCEDENLLSNGKKLSAQAAYEHGYEIVLQKMNCARKAYNQMLPDFNDYGNENYRDTVTKALPGFFKWYDARFAPQETILTMDYPTLRAVYGMTGIDAIEKYIFYISLEQKFMGRIPEEYIREVLYQTDTEYKRQFYNICQIVSRNILSHMLLHKHLNVPMDERDYENLKAAANAKGKEAMENRAMALLKQLIDEKYDGDEALQYYLGGDIKDYCTELCLGRGSVPLFIDSEQMQENQ